MSAGVGERTVAILKSGEYGSPTNADNLILPYRIDLLSRRQWRPTWSDRHLGGFWAQRRVAGLVTRAESLGVPFVQTTLAMPVIRRSSGVVAIFESEGHCFALLRRLGLFRRKSFVIVACWLAELATTMSPRRLRLYRWMYRNVDHVVVFSENQRGVLRDRLGLGAAQVVVARFGIDLDEWIDVTTIDDGSVVAIGRDEGRDWGPFFAAVEGTAWPVTVASRPRSVAQLDIPAEVDFRGYVDRDEYRRLLASASVVAVISKDLAYPTGQTVLLEAMALGKACVVTHTAAMSDYITEAVVAVPLGDALAVRAAIQGLLDDPERRETLGRRAKEIARERFGAEHMWRTVAECLDGAPPAPPEASEPA